ncbi:BamA/TamA family outer membrane protein [Pedobacter sp. CCM 8938]|uniref:BamA/TamA family outer membrane protein n=2 Tax=Pedobacter fastidiosus TaxID=2765361 RepID=A0ABR7KS41_9SPHI|nr:BamA/TamA family outer membrane protein [Pedobacter fastidiosus]
MVVSYGFCQAKADSIKLRLVPKYDSVGRFHRKIFGDNYRKDYAQSVKLPVIHLSEIAGGLTAIQKGGGKQSNSIRLRDLKGKEWVLRSVQKYPGVLLPEPLRQTFLLEIIEDNMSAEYPFGALVVPALAEAAGVPHSNPIIGVIAPDSRLGEFAKEFENTVCLLEEREPIGKSDNTAKMFDRLDESNDVGFDAKLYFRAKLLDVLVGDWDRHEDQWRWKPEKRNGITTYLAVPRDRDQVFFRSDGFVQRMAQSNWLLPMMQGYERNLTKINWFLWEGRNINSRLLAELDRKDCEIIVRDFCAKMNNQVLESALAKLPTEGYVTWHNQILSQMKQRRDLLPKLMDDYYRFFNRIVDIQLSDKNESVRILDGPDGGMLVTVNKVSDLGVAAKVLYQRLFDPAITKEIRIYLHNGSDSLVLDQQHSEIKVRIISGEGDKNMTFNHVAGRTIVYGQKSDERYTGRNLKKVSIHDSSDTTNTSYMAKDMYKRSFVVPNVGYNKDDGVMLGLSANFTFPEFRKLPNSNVQAIGFVYSFASNAFQVNYHEEWSKFLGQASLVVEAGIQVPSNRQNFFGFGNNTTNAEEIFGVDYYRARFNNYQLDAMLKRRWRKSFIQFGPSLQLYSYGAGNAGRFIENRNFLYSPDSLTIKEPKAFAGFTAQYLMDTRNSKLLPNTGILLHVRVKGYTGLSSSSNTFAQLTTDLSCYVKLNRKGGLVLAERIGGGITAGKEAFYQSLYLGGQGNLLGFRQYRFAGEKILYNNLELRAKLGQFVNYILPGEFGMMGMYDVGRVFVSNQNSKTLHHGIGGGLYFAPASLTLFRFVATHSNEGWYPYISMSFRY